jgi:hypothetical protein
MPFNGVTRRDGTEVSVQWCITFGEATFRPLRSVNVECEDPMHSRSRQGGQVCLARWIDDCIKDPFEFYKVLKAAMPLDTNIYGYKDGDRCCAILGFPYSFASYMGLKDHLCLSYDDDSHLDSSDVEFYVLEEGNGVGEWIEWMHIYCKAYPTYSDCRFIFGKEFVEEDLKVNDVGVLPTAGDMWIIERE